MLQAVETDSKPHSKMGLPRRGGITAAASNAAYLGEYPALATSTSDQQHLNIARLWCCVSWVLDWYTPADMGGSKSAARPISGGNVQPLIANHICRHGRVL